MKEEKKKRINNRPLVFVTLLFAAGILTGLFCESWLIGAVAAGGLIAVLFWLSKCSWKTVAAMGVFFAVGLLYTLSPVLTISHEYENEPMSIVGKIVSVDAIETKTEWNTTQYTVVVSPQNIEFDKNIRVYITADNDLIQNLNYGTILTFDGKISTIPSVSNEFQRNTRLQAIRNGVGYTAYLSDKSITIVGEEKDWYTPAVKVRQAISDYIMSSAHSEDAGGILTGILLGDKSDVDEDVMASYRNTGIAHILAVSGLHVGFLVLALGFILEKIKVDGIGKLLITAVFLAAYCFLTAFSASTIRASVMAAVVVFAKVYGEKYDSLSSLSLAALILLAANPLNIIDVGFILSFTAVISLCTFSRRIGRLFRKLPATLAKALTSLLAVQIGVLPCTACFFGNVPIYGILLNLLAIPMAGFCVIGGLFACLIGLAIPAAGSFLLDGLSYGVDALTAVAQWIAQLPGSYIQGVMLSPIFIVAYGLMAFVLSEFLMAKRSVKGIACACILAAAMGTYFGVRLAEKDQLKIVVFATGNSDCIYISDGEHRFLVDTATESKAANTVVPYLQGNGITYLDGVFISHDNNDHAGGYETITEKVACENVYCAACSEYDREEAVRLVNGDVLEFGSLRFRILSDEISGKDENENSLVFVLEYGDFSMLFTGDIGFETEERILKRMGDCDLVKAAHHGSKYSFSNEFIEAISPEYAIITAKNPAEDENSMIDRLTQNGVQCICTGQSGMLTVSAKVDGAYTIKEFNKNNGTE